MKIQAEVSLYPLRTEDLGAPIEEFCQALVRDGVTVRQSPMSARLSGESALVWASLGRAFTQAAETNDVVLVAKVSNACPED